MTESLSAMVCGHVEARLDAGNELTPVVQLSEDDSIGLCVEVPPETELDDWEVRLSFEGTETNHSRVFERRDAFLGRTLRFETSLPDDLPRGEIDLCGALRRSIYDVEIALGCFPIVVADDTAYRELQKQRRALPRPRLVEDLDRIRDRARESGYPFLGQTLDLIAVQDLNRSGKTDDLESAVERFEDLPAWLDRPEAASMKGLTRQNQALLAVDSGRLKPAWTFAEEAVTESRRVVAPNWIVAIKYQAEILGRVGAKKDAIELLQNSLDQCELAACGESDVYGAKTTLVWQILLDGAATANDLAEARVLQTEALRELGVDSQEPGNRWFNLALTSVLQGRDPRVESETARKLLQAEGEARRAVELRSWIDLIEARWQLESGDFEAAQEKCLVLGKDANTRRVQAWAWACAGRASRRLGSLDEAAMAFRRSIVLHRYATPLQIGQNVELDLGARADTFYRAARVELERGRPEAAWKLMASLDALTLTESQVLDCVERLPSEQLEEWRRSRERIRDLLQSHSELDFASSDETQRALEPIERDIEGKLRKLLRALPGCPIDTHALEQPIPPRQGVEYRAMAVDDEIVLLRRGRDGAVSNRRTPFPQVRLTELSETISEQLNRRELDDVAWAELVRPLAEALVPNSAASDGAAVYSLHGLLQGVPIAALPLPTVSKGTPGWLGGLTAIRARPAGAGRALGSGSGNARAATSSSGVPVSECLFVVDPRGDLTVDDELVRLYRQSSPGSRVLQGNAATPEAFHRLLGGANCLHMDTHGIYDPAFPELSKLRLSADDVVQLSSLSSTDFDISFANLLACESGAWKPTAGTGHYNFAGLFVRRGAQWAVGTLSRIDRSVASRFNQSFYTAILAGWSVPQAYEQAMQELRNTTRAVEWAPFLLLDGTRSE